MKNLAVILLIRGNQGDELTFECTPKSALSLMDAYLGGVGMLVLEGGALIPVNDVKDITISGASAASTS